MASCIPPLKCVLLSGNHTGGSDLVLSPGDKLLGQVVSLSGVEFENNTTADSRSRVGGNSTVSVTGDLTTNVGGTYSLTVGEGYYPAPSLQEGTSSLMMDSQGAQLRVEDLSNGDYSSLSNDPTSITTTISSTGEESSSLVIARSSTSITTTIESSIPESPSLSMVSNAGIFEVNQVGYTEISPGVGGTKRVGFTAGSGSVSIVSDLSTLPSPEPSSFVEPLANAKAILTNDAVAGITIQTIKQPYVPIKGTSLALDPVSSARTDYIGSTIATITVDTTDAGTKTSTFTSTPSSVATVCVDVAGVTGSTEVTPAGTANTGTVSLIGFPLTRQSAPTRKMVAHRVLPASASGLTGPVSSSAVTPSQVHISADQILTTGAVAEISLASTSAIPDPEYLLSVGGVGLGATLTSLELTSTTFNLQGAYQGASGPSIGIRGDLETGTLTLSGRVIIEPGVGERMSARDFPSVPTLSPTLSNPSPTAIFKYVSETSAGDTVITQGWTPRSFNDISPTLSTLSPTLSPDGIHITFPGLTQEKTFRFSAMSCFHSFDPTTAAVAGLQIESDSGLEILPGTTVFGSGTSVVEGHVNVGSDTILSLVYQTNAETKYGLGRSAGFGPTVHASLTFF